MVFIGRQVGIREDSKSMVLDVADVLRYSVQVEVCVIGHVDRRSLRAFVNSRVNCINLALRLSMGTELGTNTVALQYYTSSVNKKRNFNTFLLKTMCRKWLVQITVLSDTLQRN